MKGGGRGGLTDTQTGRWSHMTSNKN
jgi:hypothetical protein